MSTPVKVSSRNRRSLAIAFLTFHVLIGREQETASTTGRIADLLARRRVHDLDHRPDQGPRREVLAGSALHLLGVALQSPS